jgi:SAM-dependent methyltransferase
LDATKDRPRPGFQFVFPNANDAPALRAKGLSRRTIAANVAVDLAEPIFAIAGWHSTMFGAAVPETAIDENGQAPFWKNEIRAAQHSRMPSPTLDLSGAKHRGQQQLGGFVSTRAHRRHDARAFDFRERVGHRRSMRRAFCAGNSGRELKNRHEMPDLLRAPSTDPTSIYRYRDGLYAADLLTAALVHLDFFTWLAERPSSFEQICGGLQLKPRATDVMLTLFSAMGYIENRAGKFEVTPLAREHLVKGSPFYIGPYYASLKDRPVCKDMLSALRTDRVANWGSFKDEQAWAKAMEDETFANNFTAAMDCRGVYLGQTLGNSVDLTSRRKLLDIGGGSGIYSCSLTARFPNLHTTVFEKPPVDQVAQRSIASRGFTERVQVIAGDVFKEPLPTGFDAHLISNVLHDWDVPEVRKILSASATALTTGGLLIVHDAYINAEKNGPLPVAAYSAMLMHSTEGKCYSTAEMEQFLRAAGLTDVKFQPTAADRGVITATKS